MVTAVVVLAKGGSFFRFLWPVARCNHGCGYQVELPICSIESCSCYSLLYQLCKVCIVWWTMKKTEFPPFQAGCKHQHLLNRVNFWRWLNSTLIFISCQPPGSPGAVGREPRTYRGVFQPDVSSRHFLELLRDPCGPAALAKQLLYGATGGCGFGHVNGKRVNLWRWVRRLSFGSCSPFYKTSQSFLRVSSSTLLEASASQRGPPGGPPEHLQEASGSTRAVKPGAGQCLEMCWPLKGPEGTCKRRI